MSIKVRAKSESEGAAGARVRVVKIVKANV